METPFTDGPEQPVRGTKTRRTSRRRRRTPGQDVRAPETEERSGVTFVCNSVPALGIGLNTTMYVFQHGQLTVTDTKDIAAMRRHPWYRLRIFEAGEPEAELPPPPLPAARQAQLPQPPTAGLASLIGQKPDGTYRCKSCGDSLSPVFATESHVLMHLRTIHKVGSIPRGG